MNKPSKAVAERGFHICEGGRIVSLSSAREDGETDRKGIAKMQQYTCIRC